MTGKAMRTYLKAAAVCSALLCSTKAEDTNFFRPYIDLRSAAFNENWGVQDGWGLSLGANLNSYIGLQLSFDAYEEVLDDPLLGDVFEQSIMNFRPEIRLRYPLGEGRWVPYLFAGPGVTFIQLNDRKPPAFGHAVNGDDTLFSATFGGGIEYFVADNITFHIEGRYDWSPSRDVVVDGRHEDVNVSTPLLLFGVRAYFREAHEHPLIQPGDTVHGRFYAGFRYGSSILLDNQLNSEFRLEPVASALGGTGNETGTALLGFDWSEHFGAELDLQFAEYDLYLRDQAVGEYATYAILPQVRWHTLLGEGKWAPFASLGAGVTYAEFNDRKTFGENLKVDAKGVYPTVGASAGMEYYIARNLTFSAETQYLYSWEHKFDLNDRDTGKGGFSALNLYLGLRFYLHER
jgi:opacity protein-like surface antigen